jgi:hypothetical protein
MPDSQAQDLPVELEIQPQTKQERRSQPRVQSVLERIEDTTYTVLRKYEKQTA